MSAAALLGVGALAIGALLAFSGTSKAAAPPPKSVLERLKRALASGSAATMRAEAAQLRAEGYAEAAADLERAAAELEAKPAPASGAPRLLQRGSTGADVSAWQTFLRTQGYTSVQVDGNFGPATEEATKAFQRSRGLIADGIVGPDTLRAADASAKAPPPPTPAPAPPVVAPPVVPAPAVVAPAATAIGLRTLQRGVQGGDVTAWQLYLQSQVPIGTFTSAAKLGPVDGSFGQLTEDATKAWQKAKKIPQTGTVGAVELAATLGTRLLHKGVVGPDVSAWQLYLRSQVPFANYDKPEKFTGDGVFNDFLYEATRQWQRLRGVPADGIVGPATLAATVAPPVPAAPPPPVVRAPEPVPAVPVVTAPRGLQRGSTGAEVIAWQTFLRTQGYTSVQVDGNFGPATEDATKAFQRSRGLTADGIVGPDTLKASAAVAAAAAAAPPPPVVRPPEPAPAPVVLPTPTPAVPVVTAPRLLQRGSTGTDVATWQTFLRAQGHTGVVADGIFGPATEDATKAYQRSRGLTADGIVGPDTLKASASAAVAAAAVPAPAPAVVPVRPTRTLSKGMSGADVLWWQRVLELDKLLVPAGIDGAFGAQTHAATVSWQSKRGLTADGIVGPATLAAAGAVKVAGDLQLQLPANDNARELELAALAALAANDNARAPRAAVPAHEALAAELALHLYRTTPGAEDRELVRRFQLARGLKPTGAYGPGTAKALMHFGLVPVPPFYWPSAHTQREKRAYRDALLAQAARDPARAAEWRGAASQIDTPRRVYA